MKWRAIELFCGVGGFAAATQGSMNVVGAFDISSHVLDVYARTFGHLTHQVNIEVIKAKRLQQLDADFWWMSPPCQPYTVRGHQRDLKDHRAKSLLHLLEIIEEVKPPRLGMENVLGFASSQAHALLLDRLDSLGYEVLEFELCPTQLGVPAKRERYYMVASLRGDVKRPELEPVSMWRLSDVLDDLSSTDETLFIHPELVERHGPGMRIVDRDDEHAIANCFTSAYGKTFRFSGSFLREHDGRVRYFAPQELERLLGFPTPLLFSHDVSRRQRYKYIGNSLSVIAVRHVMRSFVPCVM